MGIEYRSFSRGRGWPWHRGGLGHYAMSLSSQASAALQWRRRRGRMQSGMRGIDPAPRPTQSSITHSCNRRRRRKIRWNGEERRRRRRTAVWWSERVSVLIASTCHAPGLLTAFLITLKRKTWWRVAIREERWDQIRPSLPPALLPLSIPPSFEFILFACVCVLVMRCSTRQHGVQNSILDIIPPPPPLSSFSYGG